MKLPTPPLRSQTASPVAFPGFHPAPLVETGLALAKSLGWRFCLDDGTVHIHRTCVHSAVVGTLEVLDAERLVDRETGRVFSTAELLIRRVVPS